MGQANLFQVSQALIQGRQPLFRLLNLSGKPVGGGLQAVITPAHPVEQTQHVAFKSDG
jgi:hypothetical protein